jgi:hypothetical protein
MSRTFETSTPFFTGEIKVLVKYNFIPAEKGLREGGMQIEPDHPESAEILSADLIVDETALRMPEALLAKVQDALIAEALEDWAAACVGAQEYRAEERRDAKMMEDMGNG